MVNIAHLTLIRQGRNTWNEWRRNSPEVRPDLSKSNLREEDLSGMNLAGANLSGANLWGANLLEAKLDNANLENVDFHGSNLSSASLTKSELANSRLIGADLSWANLSDANLENANLSEANLRGANLSRAKLNKAVLIDCSLIGADLSGAQLVGADVSGSNLSNARLKRANLSQAILDGTQLVKTDLSSARFVDCSIFGVSAWGVVLDGTRQQNLKITPEGDPTIRVDNLEVAQFVYLLLNSAKIRDVIDTIGQKAVLILGRFSPGRIEVLHALANKLRRKGFLPIVFDFEKSQERDFTETIMTLAGLSLFVIADITNPKSSPLEMQATIPNYMIPFVPIIQDGEKPFAMFEDLPNKYDWVLSPLSYGSKDQLIRVLEDAVIKPALEKHEELVARKSRKAPMRHVEDYRRKKR